MRKLFRMTPRGRRLKGLDEFEKPAFVGRMARVGRRRKWAWYAMLAGGADFKALATRSVVGMSAQGRWWSVCGLGWWCSDWGTVTVT